MKRTLNATLALAIITASMTVAGAAHAAPDSSPDPSPTSVSVRSYPVDESISPETAKFLSAMSPEERERFIATNLPATVVETVTLTPLDAAAEASMAAHGSASLAAAANGCWSSRWGWEMKSAVGIALYNFYQVGGWCANAGSVLSVGTLDYGGQTVAVGWRYEGRTAAASGIVSNQGRSYSQFKFVFGSGGWDINTRLECARVKGTAAGTATGDRVCGIY
jgi:hypothetical protein